jgi:HTH-type transcriptional regulator / antitoxin HigA
LDKPTLTDNEREYLHLLGLLVQEYEDKYYPIADASVNNILVNLIEEHQTSIDDLRTVFESEQDFNALLNGDRDITLKQIQALAKIFQVSPTVFIETSVPTNI